MWITFFGHPVQSFTQLSTKLFMVALHGRSELISLGRTIMPLPQERGISADFTDACEVQIR